MVMREILFRGKRKDTGEWIDGSLHLWGPDAFIFSDLDFPDGTDWYEVDPATVGQYTGLRDRSGERIFEGDIVDGADFTAEDGGYGVIGFEDGAFEVIGNNIIGTFHENYWGRELEVIGKIHDNPELLGGNEDG